MEIEDSDEPGVFNEVDRLIVYKRSPSRVDTPPVVSDTETRPRYGAYIAPHSELYPELFLKWENCTWHNNGPSHTFALLYVSRQIFAETKSLPFELNAIRYLNEGPLEDHTETMQLPLTTIRTLRVFGRKPRGEAGYWPASGFDRLTGLSAIEIHV